MRPSSLHLPMSCARTPARGLAWLGACALSAALAHPAAGDAPPADARLGVEHVVARTDVFEGEVLHVALRLRVSEAWLKEHGAPFARQPMDLPLRVRAPAFQPSARLTPVAEAPRESGATVSLALDDAVVGDARWGGLTAVGQGKGEPARVVDRWLALRRAFQVRGTGPLVLDAPEVDIVWAQRFQAGLLGERVPVDPRRATARGAALILNVLPLPAAERPAEYQGWIGRYTLDTGPHPTTIAEGETLHVTLTIAGVGNHMLLPAPRLAPPEGLHASGRLEERTADGWTIRFELQPVEGTTSSTVGFALDVFDPERAEYVRTTSPARRVDILPATASPTPSRIAPPAYVPDSEIPKEPSNARAWLTVAALALLLVVALLRRRRRAEASAHEGAAPDARAAALERLTRTAGTSEAGSALVDTLALHLSVSPAAVIAPDLAARLERSGLAPDLARDVARAVESDVAARYAGPAGRGEAAVSAALAARVAQALAPGRA